MTFLGIVSFLIVGVGIPDVLGASGGSWIYADQAAWLTLSGTSCNGSRQSPIDIPADAPTGSHLVDLTFSSQWETGVSGTLENTGKTIKFTPNNSAGAATVQNHLGTYDLLQFHIHWGDNDTEGSEHILAGSSYAGEIHFVHQKQGGGSTGGDLYSVVGVFLESDATISISDAPWSMLDIPMGENDTTNVTNLIYQQLLPSEQVYFQYPGSLTTPLCDEVVEWFVLQTPIRVPAAFLQELRMVNGSIAGLSGLTRNFRSPQPLNGRMVYYSAASGQYASAGLTLAVTLLVTIALQQN